MNKQISIIIISFLTFSGISNATEWYEGGTLTDKGALIWQKAKLADKVASSADFLAVMYQNKMLSPSISNNIKGVNDLAPYAIQLAICIDEATKKHANSKENTKIYTNQKISNIGALCSNTMGLLK